MEIPEVDTAGLAEALDAGAPLVDVRNPHEYEAGHVRGSMLMPLPDFVEYIDDVPVDDTVYVICATGVRSARAVQFLRSKGIDAVNAGGGIVAWIDSGRETVPGTEPG